MKRAKGFSELMCKSVSSQGLPCQDIAGHSGEHRALLSTSEILARGTMAARALGLVSAAAATPAQRTKRAKADGRASPGALTPKHRRARAIKASRARWAKSKGEQN